MNFTLLIIFVVIIALGIFWYAWTYNVFGSAEESLEPVQGGEDRDMVKIKAPHNNLIAHISGPMGVGKTTMGDTMNELYGILSVDLDIFSNQVQDENNLHSIHPGDAAKIFKEEFAKKVQEYLNDVEDPVIFVGLENNYNVYLDLPTENKFVIVKPTSQVITQRLNREPETVSGDDVARWIDETEMIYADYEEMGYIPIENYEPVKELVLEAIKKQK